MASFFVHKDNEISVKERTNSHDPYEISGYYIDDKGEVIYPWLFNKGFSYVSMLRENGVAIVSRCGYGRGIYSAKKGLIMPTEYLFIRLVRNPEGKVVQNHLYYCMGRYERRTDVIVLEEDDYGLNES